MTSFILQDPGLDCKFEWACSVSEPPQYWQFTEDALGLLMRSQFREDEGIDSGHYLQESLGFE